MFRNCLLHIAGAGLALLALTFASEASAVEIDRPVSFHVAGPTWKPASDHCLIVGDRGYATTPSRHLWGAPGPLCGFGTPQAFATNAQAIWHIHCTANRYDCYIENRRNRDGIDVVKCLESNTHTNQVTVREGRCADIVQGQPVVRDEAKWLIDRWSEFVTIRPAKDPHKCVMFNNRGHELFASLWQWDEAPNDTVYCGLGSEAAAFETGQVLFSMEDVWPPVD